MFMPSAPLEYWEPMSDPVVGQELRTWLDGNGVKTLWHVVVHRSGWEDWLLDCTLVET